MERKFLSEINPTLIAIMVAMVPTLVTIARSASGIALVPDSWSYLYAARYLFSTGSLLNVDNDPGSLLTIFPPFYPAVLAVINLLTHSLEVAAMILNILCIFSAAILTYGILRHLTVKITIAAVLTWLIFLHIGIQNLFWFALSENLYIVIALSILYICLRAKDYPPVFMGAILGLLIGCGFLTRYVGTTLLPVSIVGLLCVTQWSWRQRRLAIEIALLISLCIIIPWLLRNWHTDGTFFGQRMISPDSLAFSLKGMLGAVGRLIGPVPSLSYNLSGLMGIIFFCLLIVQMAHRPIAMLPIFPACTLVVTHVMLIMYSQITTVLNPINIRLLSPAMVATVIVAGGILQLGPTLIRPKMRYLSYLMLVISMLLLAIQCIDWIEKAPLSDPIQGKSTIDLPLACAQGQWPTFSNEKRYLRFMNVLADARTLPRRKYYRLNEGVDDWQAFLADLHHSNACLVWFDVGLNPPSMTELLNGPLDNVSIKLWSKTHLFKLKFRERNFYVFQVSLNHKQ